MLDLSGVREVYPVLVGLEDLSGIYPSVGHLFVGGYLPEDSRAWAVSMHDLEVISDLVRSPAMFLAYLRERTNLLALQDVQVVDETDLFMLFLDRRFPTRMDIDPGTVMAVTGQTEPLDRWYMHRKDARYPAAPMPHMSMDDLVKVCLRDLETERKRGWLSVCAALTSLEPEEARKLLDHQLWNRDETHDPPALNVATLNHEPQRCIVVWDARLAWDTSKASVLLARFVRERGVGSGAIIAVRPGEEPMFHLQEYLAGSYL